MTACSTLEQRYRERLCAKPAPGQGRHGWLLSAANLAVMAGAQPEQIHDDIREVIGGSLGMPDSEIRAAILKAAADHGNGGTYRPTPKPAPIVRNGEAARRRIIEQGKIDDDAELWEASPIRLYDEPEKDAALLLRTLFDPGNWFFIGDRKEAGIVGQNIRRAAEWIQFFEAGGKAGPHVIVNPLSGEPAPKKDGSGGVTLRGDGNVAAFRHCLVEFDNLTRKDQIRFWSAAKLPIRALIDSGGKSVHAWLDVSKLSNVTNCDDWSREIKTKLYEKILVPLGVDRACCNASRLSRLPGVLRPETGKFQRLLWLSPEGREVVR